MDGTESLVSTCRICQQTLLKENFKKVYKKQKRSQRTHENVCKPCDAKEYKKWVSKNRDRFNAGQQQRRTERKLRAIDYLGGKCSKCGGKFPSCVYDFHHRDPEEKDRSPGLMMSLSDSKLFAELDKCVLLCANCHRIEHHYDRTH